MRRTDPGPVSPEQALLTVHRAAAPGARPTQVPVPAPPTAAAVADLVRSLWLPSWTVVPEAARERYRATLEAEATDRLWRQYLAAVVRAQLDQARQDRQWADLLAHHPGTVETHVARAVAAHVRSAAHVVAGRDAHTGRRYVRCEVRVPTVKVIPRRVAARTASGAPTTRRRSDAERNGTYLAAVASTVLAVVRTTLAVAPAADDVLVLVVQQPAGSTRHVPVPIYFGQFPRPWAEGFPWASVDPPEAIRSAPGAVLNLDRSRAMGDIRALA